MPYTVHSAAQFPISGYSREQPIYLTHRFGIGAIAKRRKMPTQVPKFGARESDKSMSK
jgi:hypothetical protein